MTLRARVSQALGSRHGLAWATLAAGLLALPTIFGGEYLDDHLMRAWAQSDAPVWDAFKFAEPGQIGELRELGMFGWWASEDFSLHFMRPLSSLTHALDHALWPEAVWLMHLENVLLYTLCTALIGRFVARVEGPGFVTALAALVFAVDAAHGATVGWISARNTLLALAFGLLACCCHLRWRAPPSPDDPPPGGQPKKGRMLWASLAALSFVAALLAGEAGLCCFGYLLAWSLCFERGAWLRRLLPLLPYLVILAAWRLSYTTLGFGAHASNIYLDVGAYPEIFALRAILWPAAMSGAQLSLPLVDLILGSPALLYVFLALFAGIVWTLWPMLRDAEDLRPRFWLLGMLFASVPLAATHPTARTLMLSGVGAAVLVARAWQRSPRPSGGGKWALTAMFVAKLALAPLLFLPIALSTELLEGPHRRLAAELPEHEGPCVVLNVPAEVSAFYPWAMRASAGRGWPQPTYVMFAGMSELEVTRVDEHTLELASGAGWAQLPIDRFSRDWGENFAKGSRVQLEQLEVEVLEVGTQGRPTRIRARSAQNIDELQVYGFGRDGSEGTSLARWTPEVGERARFEASI